MSAPVLFVSGLGRCGTTMVMNMLAAGGMRCAGTPPIYEPPEVNHCTIATAWLARHALHAIKRLDPHQSPLEAPYPSETIWLDRNPREQARSQIKFVCMMTSLPRPNREARRQWERNLMRDRRRALDACGPSIMRLSFEDILEAPSIYAQKIADFVQAKGFGELHVNSMMSVVQRRSPQCAPNLDMEISLTRKAQARAAAADGEQP